PSPNRQLKRISDCVNTHQSKTINSTLILWKKLVGRFTGLAETLCLTSGFQFCVLLRPLACRRHHLFHHGQSTLERSSRKAKILPRRDWIQNRGWRHSTHEIQQKLGFAPAVLHLQARFPTSNALSHPQKRRRMPVL